jgi:serine phosphatase RsbU (regulator of sigma subunit)
MRIAHVDVDGTTHAEVVVAGHPPIFRLVRATKIVARHESTSLPLGLDATQPVQSTRVELRAGDVLMLFTDGLHETIAAAGPHKGRQMGLERLADSFAGAAGASAAGLRAMQEAILGEVRSFGEQTDDRTLVLVEVGQRGESRLSSLPSLPVARGPNACAEGKPGPQVQDG